METCPPAGGVGGPPKGEARWAVAVGPTQRPLECGAPVGRRSGPRPPPGLQRQPGEGPLWDGRGAAAHRGVVEGRWVLLLWSCCPVCTRGWVMASGCISPSLALAADQLLSARLDLVVCNASGSLWVRAQIRNQCCAVQHCNLCCCYRSEWSPLPIPVLNCAVALYRPETGTLGGDPCLVNEQQLKDHCTCNVL